jgi:hypothetical protein
LKDKATLVIGQHCLEGTVAKLSKPMAIVRTAGSFPRDLTDESESSFANPSMEHTVAGVIKQKYIFIERPKPIVNVVRK